MTLETFSSGAGPALLFGLVFGLVVFGLIVAAVKSKRAYNEIQALRQQHPDEPWHWKKDWHEGVLHSQSKMKMLTFLALAFVWNALSVPLLAVAIAEMDDGNAAILVALAFPVVGLVMIGFAGYYLLQWRRFGDPVFQMAAVPGMLGGRLHGNIHIPTSVMADQGVELRLQCVRRRVTGSGKNRSTSESILWQTETRVPQDVLIHKGHTTIIPVDMHIPYDQPGTDEEDPADSIVWRLHAQAALPGVNFAARYEPPVFQTPQSDPDMTTAVLNRMSATTVADEDGHAVTYYMPADSAETGQKLREAGVRLEPLHSGGIALVFPMLRQPGLAVSTLVIAIACGTGLFFMLRHGAPTPFVVIVGILLVLMTVAVVNLWTEKSRVEISAAGLYKRGGPFGMGLTHQIPFNLIDHIDMQKTMQAGETLYYVVSVHRRDGGKTRIASRLKHGEAKAVIHALETAIEDFR